MASTKRVKAGRKGGMATLRKKGKKFFSEIGKKGHKAMISKACKPKAKPKAKGKK